MKIIRKLLTCLAIFLNALVFSVAIGFTILTFSYLSNVALFLFWYLTLPIHLTIVIFGMIGLVKLVTKRDNITRKQKFLKFLPIVSIVNAISLIIFIMIMLFV